MRRQVTGQRAKRLMQGGRLLLSKDKDEQGADADVHVLEEDVGERVEVLPTTATVPDGSRPTGWVEDVTSKLATSFSRSYACGATQPC